MTQTEATRVGEVPANLGTGTEVTNRDEFYDAPTFAPGMLENSEHKTALAPGSSVFGSFIKVNKLKEPDRWDNDLFQICLKDSAGRPFKIDNKGNLKKLVEVLPENTKIKIEYIGKEMGSDATAYHTFKIEKYGRLN